MTQEGRVKQTILAALSTMSLIPVLDLKGEKKQQQQKRQKQTTQSCLEGLFVRLELTVGQLI